MSYIMEVKLNGQVMTVDFNNYAREALARIYQCGEMEISQVILEEWTQSYLAATEDVIFVGLIGYNRSIRKRVKVTIEEVQGWVQGASAEELVILAEAVKLFFKSQTDRIILPERVRESEEAAEEVKK